MTYISPSLALTIWAHFTFILSGARGGAFASSFHHTPDAPRGPSKGRNAAKIKDDSSAPSSLSAANAIDTSSKQSRKEKAQEEKRTVTDFKIVGLELPELAWRWGLVPEKEREEEGKKRKADGTEAGGELAMIACLFIA